MLYIGVASFTDAWIETTTNFVLTQTKGSHLLQMRGLKLLIMCFLLLRFVASFTDAWIETVNVEPVRLINIVASFTDAWIETLKYSRSFIQLPSRIFYRCVD